MNLARFFFIDNIHFNHIRDYSPIWWMLVILYAFVPTAIIIGGGLAFGYVLAMFG